jgi:hypothetical protein
MAHFLEYSFDLWSIAERVLVRIPVSAPASEELVFLDYVSPRISSLDRAGWSTATLRRQTVRFLATIQPAASENASTK